MGARTRSRRATGLLSTTCIALFVAAPSASRAQNRDPAATANDGAANATGANRKAPGTAALILPTRVHVADRADAAALRPRLAKLDALLNDTAQDLGLLIDVGGGPHGLRVDESSLHRLAAKQHKLVILPILEIPSESASGRWRLRIVAATPDQRALLSRLSRFSPEDLNVRAVVMLRDVVAANQPVERPARQPQETAEEPTESARGAGRAILAINGTLFGGFLGYSLQRASGSEDPRLLYPLLAVGSGVGLGGALLVANEWNVGVGDAWYLAAAAWWPAVGSHLIYAGRFGDTLSSHSNEAWSYGLVASTAGLGLAAVGLLNRGMGDGGAMLAHSGGGFGMLIGGLGEFAVTGSTEQFPLAGMGYGALFGWMAASTTAFYFHPPLPDVVRIDLGATLGGLAGAAAASPLIFGEATRGKTSGWVAATGAGMIAGAGLAWYFFRDESPEPPAELSANRRSSPGPLVYRWGLPVPAMVAGLPTGRTPATTELTATELTEGNRPDEPLPPPGFGIQWQGVLW